MKNWTGTFGEELFRLWLYSHKDSRLYWLRHVLPNRSAMKSTGALRNAHRDRDVFVFAAGPSMRNIDPQKIRALQEQRGMHVIGINFYLATDFGRIALPDYYVWSDPKQWTGELDTAGLSRIAEDKREDVRLRFARSCLEVRDAIVARKTPLFVPVDRLHGFSHQPLHPFCDAVNIFGSNVADITRPLAYRPWTAYKALSIACWLGYRRIYLCGVDNDSFKSLTVDEQNVKRIRYEHFYDGEETVETLASTESLAKGLFFTSLTFRSLERFAGRPIVNLDPESLVDCFSKEHDLDVYSAHAARRASSSS